MGLRVVASSLCVCACVSVVKIAYRCKFLWMNMHVWWVCTQVPMSVMERAKQSADSHETHKVSWVKQSQFVAERFHKPHFG